MKALYLGAHIAKNLTDYYKIYDGFHSILFSGIHFSALTLKRNRLAWIVNMTSNNKSKGIHIAAPLLYMNTQIFAYGTLLGAFRELQVHLKFK